MRDRLLLSVILPTFNERDNIGPLIVRLDEVLAGVPHEIIVMDDRSPDGTANAARRASAGNPRVHVVERDPPAGLTRSIAEGVGRARGDLVAWLDCDFSHPPDLLPALVAPVRDGEADIACASRYVAGGSDDRDSRAARWASLVITRIARLLVDRRVTDYTTGYLVARRALVGALGLRGDYVEYCIALIGDALRAGYRVREVPYRSVPRTHGESKTATNLAGFVRRGWRYLWTIAGLALVRSRPAAGPGASAHRDVPRSD